MVSGAPVSTSTGGATGGAGAADSTSGVGAAPGLDGVAQVLEFESADALAGVGLWAGTGVADNALPIESAGPDREGSALHISGAGSDEGVDLYWHVAFRLETEFSGTRFWAKSDLAEGQELAVTVAAPVAGYWDAVAEGDPWPAQVVQLTDEWSEFEVVFAEIGISPEQPAPGGDPFGALHFAIAPGGPYDLWLDDIRLFALVE